MHIRGGGHRFRGSLQTLLLKYMLSLDKFLAVLLCFSWVSISAPVLGNLEPSRFYVHGIDFPVFSHLDYLSPSMEQVAPALKSELRLKYLVIMFSKGMIMTFIQGLLMKYLVDISSPFIMDKMMLFLPEKLITCRNMLMEILKQVLKLAIKTILKFVMRKIAAVTETQLIMKNITYFFREKNLHKPPCTHNMT